VALGIRDNGPVHDGIKTWWENAQRNGEQRAAASADAAHTQQIAHLNSLRELPDDELITRIGPQNSFTPPHGEMELQRRLKDAIETLTGELVAFREASDRAADKSERADERLERLTRWLIGLTVVLIALTGAIVALTIVLG
jgi:hypothetical protein